MSEPVLSLDALQIIDAIARRGSFAAAAEELERVPSAVSYQMQKLEENLGVTLFQRVGRRSELTPAGQHLLLRGRELLQSADALARQTREVATGMETHLCIAVDSAYDAEPLYRALAEFRKLHPDVDFDVREEVMGGGWEALAANAVQLLVGGQGPMPGYQGYRSELMPPLEMIFVVPNDHPLAAAKQPISADALAAHSRVVVHDSARELVRRSARFSAARSYCFVQSVRHKLLAQMCGVGVGYLPRYLVAEQLGAGDLLELRTDLDGEQQDHYLVWKVANRGRGLKALVPIIAANYAQ